MSRILRFTVTGVAAPQGSKRHVGRGIMVESSRKVAPWRGYVKHAAEQAARTQGWARAEGPVSVTVVFLAARPKAHYGTGRNSGVLKASAPTWAVSKAVGDVDKLLRSTFDALTDAAVIADDALVVDVEARKVYVHDGEAPGAQITLRLLEEGP